MSLKRLFAAVTMLAVTLTTTAYAGENCGESCKKCDGCEGACPVSQAMNQLPKITYQVGTEQTCCAKTAAKLAEENDAPLTYLVGKKSFDNKHTAMVALASETESFVKAFTKPKTCKVSGKTTVAGKEHCCEVMAAQTAKLVEEAMAKVAMTYKVGEKSCDCPIQAEKLAKESSAKTLFVVAGEETHCDVQARIKLAHAKYKAAVKAMVAAEKQAESASKL